MKKEDFLMALGRMQGLKNSFTGDAKDLGLGDIDYMIAGEPQENKIEL